MSHLVSVCVFAPRLPPTIRSSRISSASARTATTCRVLMWRVGGEAPSLFEPTPGADASPLLQIQVRVAWLEGAVPQQVSRTTFALDLAAAAPLLEGLPDAGEKADGESPLDEEQLEGSETPDPRFRAPNDDEDAS